MPEPNIEQLKQALRGAHDAGDVESARRFASMIRAAQTPQPTEATTLEKVAGFPLTRFVEPAVRPVAGAAQMAAHAVGHPEITDPALTQYEQAKGKGMKYWAEKSGFLSPDVDLWGPAGSLAMGRFLPGGTGGTLSRVGTGIKYGGILGGLDPVTDLQQQNNFWATKGKQAGIGAAAGGAIPTLMEAGRGIFDIGAGIKRLVSESGPRQILADHVRGLIGELQLPRVVQGLKQVRELVTGSKPTAAEAVEGIPGGSPMQAYQQHIAGRAGGPSAAFGERLVEKKTAREIASKATDTLTSQMKADAIAAVNAKGGVKTSKLMADLYDMAQRPGVAGDASLSKSLDGMRKRIVNLSKPNIKMDANDLVSIRDELKDLGTRAFNAGDGWTYGRYKEAIGLIDNAMETTGAKGWMNYVHTHNSQFQRIMRDAERETEMYKPAQRTSLAGEQTDVRAVEIPHILERDLVIANTVLDIMGKRVQPKVEELAAKYLLDPPALAGLIEQKPKYLTKDVWDSLVRAAGVTAGQQVPQVVIEPRRK